MILGLACAVLMSCSMMKREGKHSLSLFIFSNAFSMIGNRYIYMLPAPRYPFFFFCSYCTIVLVITNFSSLTLATLFDIYLLYIRSGCNYDDELIWSSTGCDVSTMLADDGGDGYFAASGSTEVYRFILLSLIFYLSLFFFLLLKLYLFFLK